MFCPFLLCIVVMGLCPLLKAFSLRGWHDNVFVLLSFCRPAGWDNEKKISIIYEHMSSMSPNDVYEDRIVEPLSRKVQPLLCPTVCPFLFVLSLSVLLSLPSLLVSCRVKIYGVFFCTAEQ